MIFRYSMGVFCFLAGCLFLTINSFLLARGVSQYAIEEWDRIAFGAAAAAVPWVIAVMPALMSDSWRKTVFGLYRPTSTTLAVVAVWILFIAYNLANGFGVLAQHRLEVVAERDSAKDHMQTYREQRDRLKAELASLPGHRPAGTMQGIIESEKKNRIYDRSAQCTDATARSSRDFCQNLLRLVGELETAEKADELRGKLDKVEEVLLTAKPVIATSDPQSEVIGHATGISKEQVQMWLPAMTPIMLEAGAAMMWHFAFSIMGISIDRQSGSGTTKKKDVKDDDPDGGGGNHEGDTVLRSLVSPGRARTAEVTSLPMLSAQRQLCAYFWANYSRPVASGEMPEGDWYMLYKELCADSQDRPLDVASFRRMAAKVVPTIQHIDGKIYYQGVLPRLENAEQSSAPSTSADEGEDDPFPKFLGATA